MVTMKKLLLALLAVAALAVVAVIVIMENTPERRMDRRYHRLLRAYDNPEKLFQRVVDDRDLLGFFLVWSFLRYKGLDRCGCGARAASEFPGWFRHHKEDCDYRSYYKQHEEMLYDFATQIEAELCDCGTPPPRHFIMVLNQKHPENCNLTRAWQDIQTTWEPYLLRKTKEIREAWLNR